MKFEKGQTVWVRNNVDGTYHKGKYELTSSSGTIYLTECKFRWCLLEDIRTEDPMLVAPTEHLTTMTAESLAKILMQKPKALVYVGGEFLQTVNAVKFDQIEEDGKFVADAVVLVNDYLLQ